MSKQPVPAPQPPVVTQPIAFSEGRKVPFQVWAIAPPQAEGYSSALPGLELLGLLDSICIDQVVDPFEIATTFSTRKRYVVTDNRNQICYRVTEESSTSMLVCCGAMREFIMRITDFGGNEVLTIHRVFKHCMGCVCCECCVGNAQQVNVSSRGRNLGGVFEVPACTRNQLEIRDVNDQVVAVLVGPSCIPWNCSDACCKDIDFRIMTPDMTTQIGDVTRKYLGCWTHYLTTADCFTVNFTSQVDVNLRALIVGSVFLMDFRWFEIRRRNNQGGLIGLSIAAGVAASQGYESTH